VFLGTHTPRLDEKGRLILPAKYRDELAGGVVVTRGQENCLTLFTAVEFAHQAELARSSGNAVEDRNRNRMFFAGAFDEIPDRQGRITIPAGLRQYAGLDRDCVVIGVNDHLEIWDAVSWTAYVSTAEQEFSQLSER
jgi:MraZ protein